jgi:hypothetical protein
VTAAPSNVIRDLRNEIGQHGFLGSYDALPEKHEMNFVKTRMRK